MANLGTARHHAAYLPQIVSAELPGCFAMTETGHGSDVQALGTTATYDPTPTSWWCTPRTSPHARTTSAAPPVTADSPPSLPSSSLTAPRTACTVLVPIRDELRRAGAGVTVSDCGPKAGLGGVDNGRLSFDHVRVPRENLLNRYGDIDANGVYTSPSTTRPGGSSPCSAPWSAAGSAWPAVPAPPRAAR